MDEAERRARKAYYLSPLIAMGIGVVVYFITAEIFYFANMAYVGKFAGDAVMVIAPRRGEWFLFNFPLIVFVAILVYNPVTWRLLGPELPPVLTMEYIPAQSPVPRWMRRLAAVAIVLIGILLSLYVRKYCQLTGEAIIEQSPFQIASTVYPYLKVRDVRMMRYFTSSKYHQGPSAFPVTSVTLDDGTRWSAHNSSFYPSAMDEEKIADIVSRRSSRQIYYSSEVEGVPEPDFQKKILYTLLFLVGTCCLFIAGGFWRRRILKSRQKDRSF